MLATMKFLSILLPRRTARRLQEKNYLRIEKNPKRPQEKKNYKSRKLQDESKNIFSLNSTLNPTSNPVNPKFKKQSSFLIFTWLINFKIVRFILWWTIPYEVRWWQEDFLWLILRTKILLILFIILNSVYFPKIIRLRSCISRSSSKLSIFMIFLLSLASLFHAPKK